MFSFLAAHFIAIVVIAVIHMAVGFFWYHPNAFGNLWVEAHGFSRAELTATTKDYAAAFGIAFLVSWVMGGVLDYFLIRTIFDAWYVVFWIWLGFVVTTQFSGVIWAKKPIKAYAIDVGYAFAAFMAMAFAWGIVL